MAVLAGDFLLAKASVSLARLRNIQIVEMLANVIANLVEGEFMQIRNMSKTNTTQLDYYLEKSYLKTASLIAESCKASSILGGCPDHINEIAYLYGKNLGLAFQVY